MKNPIRLLMRALIVLVLGSVVALAASCVDGEFFVREYMAEHQIAERAMLSEDYAFGMQGLGRSVFTFVLALAPGIAVAWLLLWQFRWRRDRPNPPAKPEEASK